MSKKSKKHRKAPLLLVDARPATEALHGYTGGYLNSFAISYDGEKNSGEIGPIINYVIDHAALRMRSWQLFLESDVCQIVFQRYGRWMIGSGLKLQAEPQAEVLKSEGVVIDPETFNKPVESRFKVYAGSKIADFSNRRNLHKLAERTFNDSIVGGDCLIVLRLINGQVRVQVIDGAHVGTPLSMRTNARDYVAENGNRVRHGVEIDATGQHVAYHVRTGGEGSKYERIAARGEKSGALMAYMVYGLEYRLDSVRGLPLIAAVMEKAKKMERYNEATLGSAEERQKIPYFVEHDASSTGENPLLGQAARAAGFGPKDGQPVDVQGKQLAGTMAATMNKQVYNLPIGSKMTQLDSDNELNFEPFFTVNFNLVCATVGIPPNVAMMLYDSNFSASRAALKDWEHSLFVGRDDFARQFYQPIYELWLDTQVLSNKVAAPGYLTALAQKNEMAMAAYRYARWVGASVPHIDPLKEVNAERAKLGPLGAHQPLTTLEAATEALNGGDSTANVQQFARELTTSKDQGLQPVPPTPTPRPEPE